MSRTPEMEAFARISHRAGQSYEQIAATLGVSVSTVKRLLYPARVEWERVYNLARQRQGVCIDCGKQISSNAVAPAKRCSGCHMRNVVHPAQARARAGSRLDATTTEQT